MYNIGFYFTIDHMLIFRVISERTWLWLIYLPIHWNCYLLNSTNFNFTYKKVIPFTPLFSIHQTHYWIDSSESEKRKRKNSQDSSYSSLSRQKRAKENSSLLKGHVLLNIPLREILSIDSLHSSRPILPLKSSYMRFNIKLHVFIKL